MELLGTLSLAFIFIIIAIAWFKSVHYLCVRNYERPLARRIGVFVAPFATIGVGSYCEFLAAYLEMVVCAMMALPDRGYTLNLDAKNFVPFLLAISFLTFVIFLPLMLWI